MTRHLPRPNKLFFLLVIILGFLALSLRMADIAAAAPLEEARTETSGIPWDADALTNAEKVIYGADDRIDVFQETLPERRAMAAATCGLVSAGDLTDNGNGTYTLAASEYWVAGKPACPGEPFAAQPTAPWCSGFMAAEDIIVTAGHCVTQEELPDVRFVFGFDMTDATTPVLTFNADQIYTGIQLIARQRTADFDYSVVRVDRAITAPGAAALPMRTSGSVGAGTQVGVIGHPHGLPKKIAFGTETRVKSEDQAGYFIANLDTYGGNSGSPVFNAASGIVEGILVRGNDDFVIQSSCFRSNTLPDDTADAEGVSKSTTFADFVYGGGLENDLCANAREVYVGPAYTGTTVGATGDTTSSCGSEDYNDVWFKFTPLSTGNYQVSLCGSDFDTTLTIYGGDCASLNEIACNDDACGGQSELCVALNALVPVFIRVAGFETETGNYSLQISDSGDCDEPACCGLMNMKSLKEGGFMKLLRLTLGDWLLAGLAMMSVGALAMLRRPA